MAARSSSYQGRVADLIRFLKILMGVWKLEPTDVVSLLGFERSDQSHVEALLEGLTTLRGRDAKDRIAYLFEIRKTLSDLFRSEDVENEWLREPHSLLDNRTPLDLLLDGGMENMLLVKEYVVFAAGR